MIKKFRLVNFQNHKNTIVTLSKRVNIFTGSSDNGKSSIIRGLFWFIKNRPVGDKDRRHYISKGEKKYTTQTSIDIVFTNGGASRVKSNTKNVYKIKGQKGDLKALRTDVPEEIELLHNMDEENIQSQDQSYFLLNLSPGNVAKKLNMVAGLEQMDKALKEINSRVRKLVSERKSLGKNVDDLRSRIAEMGWVPEAKSLHKAIKKGESDILDHDHNINRIEELITDLIHYKRKSKTTLPLQAIRLSDAMGLLAEEYQNLDDSITSVSDVLNQVDVNQKKIDQWQDFDDFDTESLKNEYEDLDGRIQRVDKVIKLIEAGVFDMDEANSSLIKYEKKYKHVLKACGKCPTCGAKT